MTIIFQKGSNFWIESHDIVIQAVLANSFVNVDVTLNRPGAYLGSLSSKIIQSADPALINVLDTMVLNVAGLRLNFGDNVTQVRVRLSNNSGSALNEGASLIVFLRGVGRGAG